MNLDRASTQHWTGTFAAAGEVTERYATVRVGLPAGDATDDEVRDLARRLEATVKDLVDALRTRQGRLAL